MSKKFKIILFIAAAAIILTAAVFLVIKLTKRDKVNEANITLFKCHMGREITDADLGDIKDTIEAAASGKVLNVEKGSIPYKERVTDGEGEEIEIELGDSVTVTLALLATDEEKAAVFSAVAKKYGLTGDHLVEIKDIYRND
jgi:hypothetical protein